MGLPAGVQRMRFVAFVLGLTLVLQAHPAFAASSGGAQLLVANDGVVIEHPAQAPVLCLVGTTVWLPPDCLGPELMLDGWDWTTVPGESTLEGSTWGSFRIVGVLDGATFSVEEASEAVSNEDPRGATTPCREPNGGWRYRNRSSTTESDRRRAIDYSSRRLSFAGDWIDQRNAQAKRFILNFAFTSDVQRHRQRLSEIWGGPLCVSRHQYRLSQLEETWEDLDSARTLEFGFDLTWRGIDVVGNHVQLGVITSDAEREASLDEAIGADLVEVYPALQALESEA